MHLLHLVAQKTSKHEYTIKTNIFLKTLQLYLRNILWFQVPGL